MKGRPTAYDPDTHNDWVWALALQGFTDVEIAKKMGISKATLNNWKKEYPDFLDSIKRGKEGPDSKVVRSLYQRATGYDAEDSKIILDAATGRPIRIERTKRHVPPDVTAGIFWTKNRQADQWRDNKKLDQERLDLEYKKLDIEREKLEVLKQRAGLSDEPLDAPILVDSLGIPDDDE